MSVTLSYIIATRNKLPYLKAGLEKLIAAKQPDEEILVADGASTDGTPEYLAGLKNQGKIDGYISEKDYGVAHAFNKLILTANGLLFTYITDDDVYYYPAIQECKKFMLAYTEIDLVNTEGGSLNNLSKISAEDTPLQIVRALDYRQGYAKWQKDKIPFPFCDLGAMFRRSSLPILGILDPAFYAPDASYAFRVTAGRANIAWYTGYSYVNISNPKSVSLIYMKRIEKATRRLNKFYLDKDSTSWVLRKLQAFHVKFRRRLVKHKKYTPSSYEEQWPKMVQIAEQWLEIKNKEKSPEFLWNK